MRITAFAKRCTKEVLRDPLTLIFGLGFPAVLIVLLSAIQKNVPVDLFRIEALAPGMTVFGLAFMTLFSANLIANDRESAFLARLYATPMRGIDFIIGYTLPLMPIAVGQSACCFLIGWLFGLQIGVNTLLSLLLGVPTALFFIGLGLLFGSILTPKQAGGICGGLLTNLTAWMAGIWFDLALVGGVFEKIALVLPFSHAVKLQQACFAGDYAGILPHFLIVCGYAAAVFLLAVVLFLRQMKKG